MHASDRMELIFKRRAAEAAAFIGPMPFSASIDNFARVVYLCRAGIIK